MKRLLVVCAAWWLGLAAGRADLTVVQKVEGVGQNMENTSMFKNGKTRVDTSPGTSLIMDLKTGEMINLMHVPKTYVKVSSSMAQAAIESMTQMQGGPTNAKPQLAATGKTDTISGFAAEEYTCSVAGVKVALWLTKALPNYEAVLKEMNGALGQGPMGPLMQSYGVDLANLPGFPIRTTLELQPGQTMTRTVISVSTKPVPDSEFEIPPGYTEMAVPVLTPPAAAEPSPTTGR